MTNQKNTDNNNPKSDVALWSHTPAKNLCTTILKNFQNTIHYSEYIFHSNFVFVCSK